MEQDKINETNIESGESNQGGDKSDSDAVQADSINQKIEEIKSELAQAQDALLRSHAENDNLRRRSAKELEEAQKFSITRFARDLLEVLENLHRAIGNMPSDLEPYDDHIKNFFQGIHMTLSLLESTFEKNGIVRIYPLDQKFDHNYHQAIGHLEDQTKEPNTIVQVVRSGYIIKDRLLQPALVMLSKK